MSARFAILCGALIVLAAIASGAAYVVASPRVITAALERSMTNCPTPADRCAPPGVFQHKRALASPADRLVVNPNADTVYSSAWLDLRKGPWVLRVPDMGKRYFSFQLMDAWTDVLAYISRRTGDSKGGDFLIAGPDWYGAPPQNMRVLRASTNDVWIIARTLVDDEGDLKQVSALQDQFALRPYAGN